MSRTIVEMQRSLHELGRRTLQKSFLSLGSCKIALERQAEAHVLNAAEARAQTLGGIRRKKIPRTWPGLPTPHKAGEVDGPPDRRVSQTERHVGARGGSYGLIVAATTDIAACTMASAHFEQASVVRRVFSLKSPSCDSAGRTSQSRISLRRRPVAVVSALQIRGMVQSAPTRRGRWAEPAGLGHEPTLCPGQASGNSATHIYFGSGFIGVPVERRQREAASWLSPEERVGALLGKCAAVAP